MQMRLISREELCRKLSRNEPLILVMVIDNPADADTIIPESEIGEPDEAFLSQFPHHAPIVVYSEDANARESVVAYWWLRVNGYTDVSRYAGGLQDWQHAGYTVRHI